MAYLKVKQSKGAVDIKKSKIKKVEKEYRTAATDAAKTEILLPSEPGYILIHLFPFC